MAIARIKTWVAAEVLFASDLNAEFNNFINNALDLISPLTGALNANSNDITALDELAFTDAGATASAAGRLRRNAGALIWKDAAADVHQIGTNWGLGTSTFGTSADNVFAQFAGTAPTTAPADTVQTWVIDRNGAGTAALKVRTEDSGITESPLSILVQSFDGTERTCTNSATDLSSHTVNIPATDGFIVTGLLRKTSGAGSAASLGVKVNGVQIIASTAVTSTDDQAEMGVFVWGTEAAFGVARATSYTQGESIRASSALSGAAMTNYQGQSTYAAQLPTAAITAIIVTGITGNASVTLGIKNVTVYRVARS